MVTKTANRSSNRSNVSEETGDAPAIASPKHDVPVAVKNIKTAADLRAAARPTNRLLAKQELLNSVSQSLAEISDIADDFDPTTGLNTRASELSNNVALRLFNGQVGGLLTADEVTNVLGDKFGWRTKGNAKRKATRVDEQSKTPYGYGETIRKRITRAVKAHSFAYNPEWQPDNFFKPFDRELVAEYVEDVTNGESSIFTLYNNLQDERKELVTEEGGGERVDPAYDPKKVLKLAQTLTTEGAVDMFAANPALVIAYETVSEAFEAITEALMSRDDAEAIIAAIQAAPQASEMVAAE